MGKIENDQKKLGIFERKILRKIYGPVNEKGEWRIRYNKELYELYKSSAWLLPVDIAGE